MKRKSLLILSISILCLSGCSNSFDPFDFNNVEIISNEQATFISNEATNNLSSVSSLTKSESNTIDYRSVYTGSALPLANYQSNTIESNINIYSNYGYTQETKTTEIQGDGSGDTIYFETTNLDSTWLELKEEEKETLSDNDELKSNYYLYQVNEYQNPNYNDDPIISSRYSYFSKEDEVSYTWDKQIRNLVSDSYSYFDFTYGTSEGKIYGFNESVSQNTISNPLHTDQLIITYSESMVVRSFSYDNNLGWVIDYFASKDDLYWVTSIDGSMYESPVLVQSQESLYQYGYKSLQTHSFSYPEEAQTSDAYPIMYLYNYVYNNETEQDELTFVRFSSLYDAYSVSSYGDSQHTYRGALLNIYSYEYILFSSSLEEYIDTKLGYEILNHDQLGVFSSFEVDGFNYLNTASSIRLYLIFGFTKEGELDTLDAYYWSML